MLYEIFHLKDMNLIIIWYFGFYLGLSLEEASNITTENILLFKNKLYFIRNEKIVVRNIIDKIIMIINKLIIINNLNQRDYLLCFNIKGNKNINRKDCIKMKFDGWINNINLFSQDKNNIISNLLLTRRESIRMNEREKKEFLNLDLDILVTSFLDIRNNSLESNNFNEHIISLKEYNNDDPFNSFEIYDELNEIYDYNNKDYDWEYYNLNNNNNNINIKNFNKTNIYETKISGIFSRIKKENI